MTEQLISSISNIITLFIGILGYERLRKKDTKDETAQYSKDMAILITKVDMLLAQNNSFSAEIKIHGEKIVNHEVRITDIEDTIKFRRNT